MTIKEFLIENKYIFEEKLLSEAVNVRPKVDEIHRIGNINLIENAHKLVIYVVDEQLDNVVKFAKQEGIVWAKHALTLEFKLEWIHAIRRTLWNFQYQFDILSKKDPNRDDFYTLESKLNEQIDQFLNSFFISYSHYKDELIESQRKVVEKLSVPIIPITSDMCVLPLIGNIDSYRSDTITEKVMLEISELQIQVLIMDLSGIVTMDDGIAQEIVKLLDGIKMMGCTPVITGLRPELVKKMVTIAPLFVDRAVIKGTLQQALSEYL